jgi:toxin-antitoxin system PIN domain toxin
VILVDANVLIYAFRRDVERHAEYHSWLHDALSGAGVVGISELVLSAVVRIATHPRVFARPSSLDEVFDYTAALMACPSVVSVLPGKRHWAIFERLCRAVDARGNMVPDAYLAALAIEKGARWITTDRDFARFPDLDWSTPLSG